jgi:hypothetical protein
MHQPIDPFLSQDGLDTLAGCRSFVFSSDHVPPGANYYADFVQGPGSDVLAMPILEAEFVALRLERLSIEAFDSSGFFAPATEP